MKAFHVLKIERKPSDQLLELLQDNIIGTPGQSMVYKHQNVIEKVSKLNDPYFANLSIRNRLYGAICFSKRQVYSSGKSHQAFYLRYFTFRESFRTTKPKRHERKAPSPIRDDVAKLMDGEGLDYHGDLMVYAYVDRENTRSKRIIDEFGFQKIGSFQVLPFNRLFPKRSKHVEIANREKHEEIKERLIKAYKDEQLVSFESLFLRGNYFVFMDHGNIVCGVQAIPDQWEFLEMPGAGGKILMTVLPKIPILNRLFHPRYRFVFLESIFCTEGHEHHLGALFESVLQHYKVNSGILCLDRKSMMYSKVKKNNLGLTHKLQGEKQIDIVLKISENSFKTAICQLVFPDLMFCEIIFLLLIIFFTTL